jgi:sugar phosphate isomerase/epimerase
MDGVDAAGGDLGDLELVFWPGSLTFLGFRPLLEAAAAGGYHSMAISPVTIHQLLAAGWTADDITAEAEGSGITLTQLDGVASWAPIWHQAVPAPTVKQRFAFSAEHCLDLASAVGLNSVLIAAAFDIGALETAQLIEPFAAFCDSARMRGLRVELEFVPFWGIPTLEMAWDIVRTADRPDTGLLIDTWHLQKGSPDLAADLELIGTIPGDRLASIQLADAAVMRRADELYTDGHFRLFPGEGELALETITATVAARSGLRRIGTKIFGPAIDQLALDQAGRRCAQSTQRVLDRLHRRHDARRRGRARQVTHLSSTGYA